MGLRVWLPLNGSLENQGLATITTTNSGATSNTSGKIGNCYSFNASSKIINAFGNTVTSAIGSLACWVKFNALPASNAWYSLIQVGNLGGFATCRLGLYVEYGAGLNVSINGSSTNQNYTACPMTTGVWYHLCATFDGTVVTVYLNGNQIMSKTATVGSYTTAASYIYVSGTSSYYLNGYMNDVRYYDHALSVKEVRELARGLIVHYKLDKLNGTKVVDCSGFKYHGTIMNTLATNTDTPRYDCSTYFNTTSSKIALPVINFSGTSTTYTFAWWQYMVNTARMAWGFGNGNRLNVYYYNPICWNTGDGTSTPFQDGTTTISPSELLNSWHHIAVTGDGAAAKIYIDGVYRGTAKTWRAITGTQIYISGWNTGTNYSWSGGKLSDFRIYATTLSAADVADLYATSAEIDRNGNYYSREVIEK